MCAGSKCSHPHVPEHDSAAAQLDLIPASAGSSAELAGAPSTPAEQLLCMASRCGSKGLKIQADQDTKDLASCLTQRELPDLFPSLWACLGDEACRQAATCWSKPFESCSVDIWHALTDADQRERIEKSAMCLNSCQETFGDDFVSATFCVLDHCGQEVLSCQKDDVCRSAVQCLPATVSHCAVPQFEAYSKQELLRNVTKFLGRGLEY